MASSSSVWIAETSPTATANKVPPLVVAYVPTGTYLLSSPDAASTIAAADTSGCSRTQQWQQDDKGRGGGGRGCGRSQGRAYAITEAPEIQDHSVIRGIIVVFDSFARILIHCGASHSFIST